LASTQVRRPSRRFLPPDPRVEEPYRLTPGVALRVGLFGMLVLAVFAVLFLRLWALQVLSGKDYLRRAENNQIRTVRVDSPRGAIVDRFGRLLVSNAPGTEVELWPADLPRYGRYDELRRLAATLRVPLDGLLADVRRRAGDPLTPVTVKSRVNRNEIAYLAEHASQFRGVDVANTYLRTYPHRSLAAQLLGYVTEISPQELKAKARDGYRAGDRIGQSGVEGAFDAYLRGRPGLAQMRVDSLGRPRSQLTPRQNPVAGDELRLTLDLRLQEAAEQALQQWTAHARSEGCFGCWASHGGAIVALDPRDGAIRALASWPTYSPSVYAGRVDPRKLAAQGLVAKTAAEKNHPALDRATDGLYPPGSTFKPVTALAAMQEGLVQPYSLIPCTPDYKVDGQLFKNWDPYVGTQLTLPAALEQSCDTYFYRVGMLFYNLSGDRGQPLQSWASRFGFGRSTGLDVGGDAAGLLPTISWRKKTFKDPVDRLWKPGDSIQLAIGQKDLQVTPLQMARFYAIIANGGRLVTPYVVSRVEQPGPSRAAPVVLRRFEPKPPRPVGLDPFGLEAVRAGLDQATHGVDGTSAAVFSGYPVRIAGKTGTAEKAVTLPGWTTAALVSQSWWCGYGPEDKPTLVVCALIENGGHGGTAAAPAAMQVFERYFGVKANYQLPPNSD
jgi:penicillin-binding protein 2